MNLELNKQLYIDTVYPVGSIYMSVNSTSPATLFGGTWEQVKDRFLLGAGNTYTAGNTGGEASHTLTIAEMPSHYHDKITLSKWYLSNWATSGNVDSIPVGGGSTTNGTNGFRTSNTGGGGAHNNMPPYLVVYMWKRTA